MTIVRDHSEAARSFQDNHFDPCWWLVWPKRVEMIESKWNCLFGLFPWSSEVQYQVIIMCYKKSYSVNYYFTRHSRRGMYCILHNFRWCCFHDMYFSKVLSIITICSWQNLSDTHIPLTLPETQNMTGRPSHVPAPISDEILCRLA